MNYILIKLILIIKKTMIKNKITQIEDFIMILFKIIKLKMINLNNIILLIIFSLKKIKNVKAFKVKIKFIMIIRIKT